MRYIRIEHVEPGMRVAKHIQDPNGGVLVTANSNLKENHLAKLQALGYAGIYIDDDVSNDIIIEDLVSYEVRMRAIEYIKNKDVEGCVEVAEEMVREIMDHQELSLEITDLRSYQDFVFCHSVNVAIYCCIIGMGMGYKSTVLCKLVQAALMHDMGKMSIDPEILNKTSRLTPEEYNRMKEHPEKSFKIVQKYKDVSDYVKDAVLHHHENEDGSGYPDGVDGSKQSIYTKILHVADVYDALISKRPYKAPYSPYEAIEYLMGACDILFDKKVVGALIQYVPLFPLGTEVVLSDGQRAIIYKNRGPHNLRPVIKTFDGFIMDLTEPRYSSVVIKMLDTIENQEMERSEMERQRMLDGTVRPKLLVVDDMLTNLQMLRDILEDQYDMVFVKSGQQALTYLSKNKMPDLILMDIEMPVLNGIDTVRIIREKYGEVPVLFVTARRDKQSVLECKEMHMSSYIIKPYHATFIRAEIERILHGQQVN